MSVGNYNYMFKFIIIGDTYVGKSNMLSKYTYNRFNDQHEITIGCEFMAKNITIKERNVRIQAGQEAFRSITRSYYKNSASAMIVYDICNRESFLNIERWLKECTEMCSKSILLILVGNKVDLEGKRSVTFSEGEEFAKNNNMSFFETSALTGYNIEELFTFAAGELIDRAERGQIEFKDESCGIKVGTCPNSYVKQLMNSGKSGKKKCCK